LVDADLVKEVPGGRVIALPFTRIARELGRAMAANIVALGALAALTGAVSSEGLKKAVIARVPASTRELNEKALEAGLAAAGKSLAEQAATTTAAPVGGEEQGGRDED
jgi:2-oxoglutarate ferredoxin oxidoreductase subunit gamma